MIKSKKGIDGMYYAVSLLFGMIIGIMIGLWLVKNGIIDPAILPF